MEYNNQPPQKFDQNNASGNDKVKEAIERFKELPKNAQIGIGVAVLFLVFSVLNSGGGSSQQNQRAVQQGDVTVSQNKVQQVDQQSSGFEAVDPSRESLQRGFYTQQRKELAELRTSLIGDVKSELENVGSIKDAVSEQQKQMQQMIETFNDQIRSFETSNQEQRQEINRLVEQARVQATQGQRAQAMGVAETAEQTTRKRERKRITQTSLRAGGPGMAANPDQALLSVNGTPLDRAAGDALGYIEQQPEPFLPPLGFVKGTLLNGFDALVDGSVPSLVRLSGSYKTAMNSTVSLDGCVAMVEFEGQISTERAIGKPSRMTCVYPDRGAVTYDLSGYVVDANDGIVGVPGVFYEGDASRIAAALMADFAAGMAEIVRETQFSEETSEGGTATNLTGSQAQAEIASGVSNMMGSLRNYLEARSSRVVPFVRVDPTRDIHVVILSGIELRHAGSAWTLLVDGEKADRVKAQNEEARRKAEQSAAKQAQRL